MTSRTTSPASSHFLIIPLIISIFYPLLQVVYLQVSCSSLKYSITRPEHQHGYLRPPSLNNLSFLLSLFRNAKCTRSETTVVLNTFLYLVFLLLLLWFMDNSSSGFQRDGKLSEIKWKCKQNKNLRLYTTSK